VKKDGASSLRMLLYLPVQGIMSQCPNSRHQRNVNIPVINYVHIHAKLLFITEYIIKKYTIKYTV